MTPNPTPTPKVILWRGIRFEHDEDSSAYANEFRADELHWTLTLEESLGVELWSVHDGDYEVGEGGTAEEALEDSRSQVESIARAVGLIPDEPAELTAFLERLPDVWNRYQRRDLDREEFEGFIAELAESAWLAAKLGKGER